MPFKRIRATGTIAALAATLGFFPLPSSAEGDRANSPVTLINAFEIDEDKLGETISFWERARDFLATQPGYISTRLHQSLSPDARFQLVNVARWESPQAFQAAIGKMRASGLGSEMKGTVFHAALYEVIRSDEER